ncbi:MAG: LytTR family transcriptional regulator DNA-binding domain-containing protein [Cyclobacteriaceae bacterium]
MALACSGASVVTVVLEKKLRPKRFMHVHRSYIISLGKIEALSRSHV